MTLSSFRRAQVSARGGVHAISFCSTQAVAAKIEEVSLHALVCFRALGKKDACQDE